MIAYMKILFATSEEFIAPSLSNHTGLLLPFATPSDKVSNLIFMASQVAERSVTHVDAIRVRQDAV